MVCSAGGVRLQIENVNTEFRHRCLSYSDNVHNKNEMGIENWRLFGLKW